MDSLTINVVGQGPHESRSKVTWVKVRGHITTNSISTYL